MSDSLASRVHEANATLVAGGQLDAVPDFFTEGYVAHLTEEDMAGGHGAIRGFLEMLRNSFPDLTIEVEIFVENGDRIAWQRTHRGTHAASFMGIPASGNELVWRDMIVSRFEDGRIAEEWAISDLAERMLTAK